MYYNSEICSSTYLDIIENKQQRIMKKSYTLS